MKEEKTFAIIEWKRLFDKKHWKRYAILLLAIALITTLVVWICTQNKNNAPLRVDGKLVLTYTDTDAPFFSLKLKYEGEALALAVLNGERIV